MTTMAHLQLEPSFIRLQLMPHLFRLDFVPLVLRRHLMTALIAVQLRFLLKIRRRIFLAAIIFVGRGFPSKDAVLVAKDGAEEEKRYDSEWNDNAD